MIVYESYPKNYFLKRIMSEERAQLLREKYISLGFIIPFSKEKSTFQNGETTSRYKAYLIKLGIITPKEPDETPVFRPRVTIVRPLNH